MKVFLVFLLLAVASSLGKGQNCGPNEEYKETGQECIGCGKLGKCVDIPKPLCSCKENYVRNIRGVCVTKEECEMNMKCLQIDALSEYRECAPCPKVCPGQEPVSCDKSCKPGCICIENTVLNTDINKCMWNKACPVPNGNETPKPNQRARFGRRYSRN